MSDEAKNEEITEVDAPDAGDIGVVEPMAEPVVSDMKISHQEWFRIARDLELHHAAFYKLWDMGVPIFSDAVKTAAVQFDSVGEFVIFHFNPHFWNSLDHYNKVFVIAHEALHILLNHGVRARGNNINAQAINTALDVVVNHLLVRRFGLDREWIMNQQHLCWVDTVFHDKNPLPRDDESFEHYLSIMPKIIIGVGGAGKNSMGSGQGTVDDHSFLSEGNGEQQSHDWSKAIDKLNRELNEEEKEQIRDILEKNFQGREGNKPSDPNTQAGVGTGGVWTFAGKRKVEKKKKWETVIRRWAKKYLKEDYKDQEQWARLNRRFTLLPSDMFLPSEMEIDEQNEEKHRIEVHFYLDTSGSCWGLKDRFFNAAKSLPEERFDVRLFCFDTQVVETDIESNKVYGGGGTAFDIIEASVQKCAAESGRHPEAVWIITDGYGTHVKPQQPDKWYWFLSEGGSRNLIPKESAIHELKDFE